MPGSPKLPNYLRAHRKRLGLSQKDLARLMGWQSGAQCSRYERFQVEPQLEAAFMCSLITGKPADTLFAGVHRRAKQKVKRQARMLLKRYRRATPSRAVQAKIEILEAICSER